MIYVILAVAAGFSIILSRILNANMALKIGIYQGTLMNYVVGLSFALVLLFAVPQSLEIKSDIPYWALFGGTLGVIVIALSNYITHRVSNFYITLLMFIGQQATGAVIDLFLGKTISAAKLIGGALIIIGLAYNIFIDRSESRVEPS